MITLWPAAKLIYAPAEFRCRSRNKVVLAGATVGILFYINIFFASSDGVGFTKMQNVRPAEDMLRIINFHDGTKPSALPLSSYNLVLNYHKLHAWLIKTRPDFLYLLWQECDDAAITQQLAPKLPQ